MKEKLKPYLMLLPILIILMTVFVSGIIMALAQSLGYFSAAGLREFTFKYYREVFLNRDFLSSLSFSLYTSLVSSLAAVFFGVVLALCLLRGRKGVERLFRLPVIMPHIVSSLLVYNILSQSGILPRLFYALEIIGEPSQFPSLLYEKNGIGIILAYLWKEIPFVALTVYTVLGNVSKRLSEVAHNLGANRRQVFLHVTLPLIAPSLLSAFILIFGFSFGAYELPLLLGPTTPKTLGVQAYIEYSNPVLQNRPYAMVINVIITVIALILTYIYHNILERVMRYEG